MKILRALLALALLLTPMRALAQEAKALTADCVITSGKVKTVAAHDGDYTTAWRSERVRRPYLEFELPEGETAGYLYVCFTEMPQSWAVEERVDGKWRVVAEGGTDYLHALVELNGQNHFRIVENSGVTTRLKFNEVFVFGAGELPDWVQRWQPTAEKADLLVLATHPDDELIFFGGTIPTYAVERGLYELCHRGAAERTAQRPVAHGRSPIPRDRPVRRRIFHQHGRDIRPMGQGKGAQIRHGADSPV